MDQSMRFWWVFLAIWPLFYHANATTWQAENQEEALFLRRIADFWQEGEYQLAKIQMEEFITEYPKSSFFEPLCVALGDLSLREKNFSVALNYYSKVKSPEYFEKIFSG